MTKKLFKSYWLILLVFMGCSCGIKPENRPEENDLQESIPLKKYYNLEAIDLNIEAKDNLSFEFNSQKLTKEGDLYLSEDLMVYQTKGDKWQATVIGKGDISSNLKISTDQDLLQEVGITTTHEVFGYQAELGKEWPGMHNMGNTCFANVVYKLIARCSGFDNALSKGTEGSINTALRNIVNGIRLGKKSALQEGVVNRKISKLLLDEVTKKSGKVFNCGNQDEAEVFFGEIESLLHPTASVTEDLFSPELDNLINKFKRKRPAFKYIVKEDNGDVYQIPHLTSLNTPTIRYLSLPQFFMHKSSGFDIVKEKIAESLQVPLWDYKTDHQLEEATYKLIGFAYHLGSSRNSGHYVAYINFNEHGWYKHNDSDVMPVDVLPSVTTNKLIAVYEWQD